ncbi:hypothetical protein KMC60_gp02 [Achromobacter phage vB_AxyP_19-32_Axy11]|uniref:Uncharacterized protein n=1 Tax=Achromobacter phage vB_AxyP_19-32_Axy11 TaxID=2591042 RepID=A0A514CU82_9CAUD|nr:hypothetical protein KMC60_gp02 [Achromobacter phage vB_AxyP_19-32_Axy11]QDH84037.1 hypothetical protein Axy11_002 [Achromobacter phage vB_AxyP_19-32_Axy11]
MSILNNVAGNNTGSAFDTTFGKPGGNQTVAKKDLPKAQFWLNIGYVAQFNNAEGQVESRFIALPMGMPLDTMDHLKANSSNEIFRAMQSAQNNLLDQLLAKANTMAPGEELIIGEGQLVIQLRRVKAEQAPLAAEANPLAKQLTF